MEKQYSFLTENYATTGLKLGTSVGGLASLSAFRKDAKHYRLLLRIVNMSNSLDDVKSNLINVFNDGYDDSNAYIKCVKLINSVENNPNWKEILIKELTKYIKKAEWISAGKIAGGTALGAGAGYLIGREFDK